MTGFSWRKYKCIKCNNVYSCQAFLQRHMDQAHIRKSNDNDESEDFEIKKFKCTQCDDAYSTQEFLELHIEESHSMKNKELEIEDALLKSKDEFVVPKPAKIARVTVEKLRLQCHKCPKTFTEKDLLAQHITFDHTKMSCNFCDKEFKNFSVLNKHISEDHLTKWYICDTCNKTFFEESDMIDHKLLRHENEKTNKRQETKKSFKIDNCNVQ